LKLVQHFKLYECMHRFQRLNFRISAPCISHSEFFILKTLMLMSGDDNAGVTVSDLALEIGVSSPAVSRRLNSLDQKGLTERFIDTKNRRNTFVIITPKGVEAIKKREDELFAFMTKVINTVGKDDFENTVQLLSRLIDVMEKIANEMEAKEPNDKDTEIP